jgi:hypothetical protein
VGKWCTGIKASLCSVSGFSLSVRPRPPPPLQPRAALHHPSIHPPPAAGGEVMRGKNGRIRRERERRSSRGMFGWFRSLCALHCAWWMRCDAMPCQSRLKKRERGVRREKSRLLLWAPTPMPHCSALRVTQAVTQVREPAQLWIILAPCRFGLKLSGGREHTARYQWRACES